MGARTKVVRISMDHSETVGIPVKDHTGTISGMCINPSKTDSQLSAALPNPCMLHLYMPLPGSIGYTSRIWDVSAGFPGSMGSPTTTLTLP